MNVILKFYMLAADVDYRSCCSSILAIKQGHITHKSELMDEWKYTNSAKFEIRIYIYIYIS